MPNFIDVAVSLDPSDITNAARKSLAAAFAAQGVLGWTSNPGNLEDILLQTVALMSVDGAQMAAQVPSAIFRLFGTQLFALPYNNGTFAVISSTWTLADTLGHTITQGTQVVIDNFGFYVQSNVVVPPGSNTATVPLVAVDIGVAYNGLGVSSALVDGIPWVTSVVAIGQSVGGADQEDDIHYQNRLVAELALQAPRPITAADYSAFTLVAPPSIFVSGSTSFTANTTINSPTLTNLSSFAGVTIGATISGPGIPFGTTISATNISAGTATLSTNATATGTAVSLTATTPSGQGVGRAVAIDGFSPAATNFTANTTSGSATLTAISSMTGITVGSVISGPGIPAGSTVTSVGTTTAVLNNNATATATGAALTSTGSYSNGRTVAIYVTDSNGNPLSAHAMQEIQVWLAGGVVDNITYPGYREANFVINVLTPTYTKIYVSYTIAVTYGSDPAGTVAAVNAALTNFLSPATWGSTGQYGYSSPNTWSNNNVVRYNSVVGVIESVPGVGYVPAGSAGLTIGTAANPTGTSDITLTGAAPLPLAGTFTATTI